MIDPTFSQIVLPGDLEGAGHEYGRLCRHLLAPARREVYLDELCRVVRTDRDHLAVSAARWASRLPARYRLQMEAMARGAGVGTAELEAWLFADIAPPRPAGPLAEGGGSGGIGAGAAEHQNPAGLIGADGPMCTGVILPGDRAGLGTGAGWVARNCDWLVPVLWRGTAAVTHRSAESGRIPCMTVGIMGDLDADTGMNAERLWLHMHTLLVHDEPRAGVSCISWLFWMREALETCATIDDVAAFILRTDRDRGVLLFALDGKTGESAIFECSRSGAQRIEPGPLWPGGVPLLAATNHPQAKHPPLVEARYRRPGSTLTRFCRARELLMEHPPEHLPDDLIDLMSDPLVELRETSLSASLRTIYSAMACPAEERVYFASGAVPAASEGMWRTIRPGWVG